MDGGMSGGENARQGTEFLSHIGASSRPFSDGLYTLSITLKDGRQSRDWIILAT